MQMYVQRVCHGIIIHTHFPKFYPLKMLPEIQNASKVWAAFAALIFQPMYSAQPAGLQNSAYLPTLQQLFSWGQCGHTVMGTGL